MPPTETLPDLEREERIEREEEIEKEHEPVHEDDGIPPIFGRCPVCGKPLHPRDRFTGEPKAPPIGQGMYSRAKCDRCGAIIEYVGDGKWVPVEFLGESGS